MSLPIPRRFADLPTPIVLDALAQATQRHARDVDAYFAIQPTLEVVTFSLNSADLPVTVLTQTARVVGVLRMSSRKSLDEGAAVASSDTSIAWEVSAKPDEPGVTVTALGGLTAGIVYEITCLVIGKRG